MSEGIIYVATGKKHLNESMVSAASTKKSNKDISITLLTDEANITGEFDHVLTHKSTIKHQKSGFLYKITGIQASPYHKTIFLDSDTYIFEDISELFDLLNHFDLLICQDHWETADILHHNKTVKAFHPFNTGLVAFNMNDKVKSFMSNWEKEFHDGIDSYRHDQPAFMKALLTADIKTFCLPSIYNFRPIQNLAIHYKEKVKVLHGHYTEREFLTLERKINDHLSQRVWHAKSQRSLSWSSASTIEKVYKKLKFK